MLRLIALAGLVFAPVAAHALPIRKPAAVPEVTPVLAPAMAFVALDERLPRTKLMPAIAVPDACVYRYRVSTRSPQCQQFLDQSLGFYYSYVWIEAARSAETAIRHDPDCAYAWLALAKGLEKWGQGDSTAALKKAQELMPKASHREQLLITAKLQEKGLLGTATNDDRKKQAARTLDELLSIYEDDEEGWFARGVLVGGFQGGSVDGVPFYKSALRVNPLHPGANHELVHFYENSKRPALGWKHAEAYIASSPGIPHSLHMQSHLAMRIGKWDKTSDRSTKAIELQLAYHRTQGVKPPQDHQFSHHLETLTLGLLHDGRYREAMDVRREAEKHNYKFGIPWFRLALAKRDWAAAEAQIKDQRRADKALTSYLSALLHLEKGDLSRAAAEVDVLRQLQQAKRSDRKTEQRLWEVQGLLQCATGSGAAGVKLLQRTVDKTKDDYNHHAWGGGAYYMEAWGIGALTAGDPVAAEEAFLEALAHDAGSAKAACGMEALCVRLGRSAEAKAFGDLARRLWSKADPHDLETVRTKMAERASKINVAATASASTPAASVK